MYKWTLPSQRVVVDPFASRAIEDIQFEYSFLGGVPYSKTVFHWVPCFSQPFLAIFQVSYPRAPAARHSAPTGLAGAGFARLSQSRSAQFVCTGGATKHPRSMGLAYTCLDPEKHHPNVGKYGRPIDLECLGTLRKNGTVDGTDVLFRIMFRVPNS